WAATRTASRCGPSRAATRWATPETCADVRGRASAMRRFADRREAGRQLAGRLRELDLDRPVVLGLPRGGVVVAAAGATALDAPLDVIVVRKVGAPGRPELGVGAVAEGASAVFDRRTIKLLGVGRRELDTLARREQAEVDRRIQRYRQGRPMTDVARRDV